MNERAFCNVPEFWMFYRESLADFYRILKSDGISVFKRADAIESSKQYLNHVRLSTMPITLDCILDLFVPLSRNVLISPNQINQQHAKVFLDC